MQAPHSIAHAVSARFADRPTLDSVIRQQLATAIGARYPSLSLDLSRTRLARPQRRGWLLQPFMPAVHDALASGVALDFSDVNGSPWYLSDEPPKRLKLPGVTGEKLDMQVIAALVDELPRILPIALQNALTEYWDSGPWRWLAGVLRDTLRISTLSQASLDPPARETLEQLLERPDREARIARHGANAVIAYSLEATLTTAERSVTLIGPQLALVMGADGPVARADIGQYYPRLLETHLLGESAEARQRETLFAEQQAVQLPLLALELNLKQQAGLSATGARLVAALMEPDAANHRVNQRPVVIRHLALLRTPGAQPDTVTAMYLIEAEDIRVGPHVLYRPLYAEALQEFASREALFEAIAESGPLQDSVLTWLSDKARPIYANGGFREPHSLRFGQGDEFAPLSKPAPATLSVDGINDELQQCRVTGRLMSYLYSDHARALVEQANRESVSNSEGRWQVLREGSSLLFGNLLLPLLRGPAMLTGWLWGLMASLDQDIPALASQDPQTRELATCCSTSVCCRWSWSRRAMSAW